MPRSRRVFSKEFKAKVVLEALKEKNTFEVLAKKYELLPNQISMWKSKAIKNITAVFNVEKPKEKSNEIPSEKLYALIGELSLGNDFLKKSYSNL
jgi:transposase-like protein